MFLAQYNVEEILPWLQPCSGKKSFTLPNGESYDAKIGTHRLQCLKRSQTCAWCGRTGNLFVLERSKQEKPHLNLYHVSVNDNYRYLLMTQDHIIPRSRGGLDHIDNLQTLCSECNQAKGDLTPLQFVLKMTGWRVPV